MEPSTDEMDLDTARDAFRRVSKKQKLCASTTREVIGMASWEIEQAARRLGPAGQAAGAEAEEPVFCTLRSRLNDIGLSNLIGAMLKDLVLALSKYGKVVDKVFGANVAKAHRDAPPFDRHVLNRIVAMHFYRQGLFELGDCFVAEMEEPDTAQRGPFLEMYEVLEHLKVKNLEPALAWVRSHREQLRQKGSSLEFKLHRLRFTQLLQKHERCEALLYARSSFSTFAPLHMQEIQRLMGCLLWANRLEASPYADLFLPSHWDSITPEFTRECCAALGQPFESPLRVAVAAGFQALPTLLKMATVLSSKLQEWQAIKQLPVEIELSKEFQFHSIFACPVSREQSTSENPPMLMPCGHVLCKQSLQKLAKSRLFKCPYCPVELSIANCKQLFF